MNDHRSHPWWHPSSALRWRGRSSPVVAALCVCLGVGSADAQSAPPGPKASSAPSMEGEGNRGGDSRTNAGPVGDETMARNAAARSRILECGHQWSAKKKAGTANGTWKDFFKTCVTRQ